MRGDWILDVLTDLKTFAKANGMATLAEQLDDTAIVAMTEIAMVKEAQDGEPQAGDAAVGLHLGGTRTG